MVKANLIVGLAAIALAIVSSVAAYIFLAQIGSSSGFISQNLYVNETSFGSTSTLASPSVTLTFTVGQIVTITLHNVGESPHNWAIVDAKSSSAIVLWSSQIGNISNPVMPGGSASVTFSVGTAGSYYYISQVSDDVSLGLWGIVTVKP
jgi:plastocyanin